MSDLEELERRKKELELRRDIHRLERNERITEKLSRASESAMEVTAGVVTTVVERSARTGRWSWLWVAPLGLVGAYLVLGGLVDGPIIIAASTQAAALASLSLNDDATRTCASGGSSRLRASRAVNTA